MNWKKLLLFLLLFSLLVGSLLYYVLPKILFPLRKDTIPSDAYIIPWMKPNPSIAELGRHPQLPGEPPPFNIHFVMANALKFNITFRIEIPNDDYPYGTKTRVVPSTVYLGHDSDYLYIGGEFIGMYANPYKDPKGWIPPNYLQILFDVENDGVVNFPESGSRLGVFVTSKHGAYMLGYHDMVWAYSSSDKASFWYLADNYYWPNAQPAVALGNAIWEYDNSSGTLTILFSRFLRRPPTSEINALQMRHGERWVMGFLLQLGFATWSEYGDYVDAWPQREYSYLSNNCSLWPKLCIDLTNPPTEFDESSNRI